MPLTGDSAEVGQATKAGLEMVLEELKQKGYKTCAPELKYCTDNAAMVASCAYFNPIKSENSLMLEVFSRC